MDWRGYIDRDPEILLGKPVVKGTRLSVELILEKLASQGVDEILGDYPQLSREQIQAVVLYALDVLRTDDVVPALPA